MVIGKFRRGRTDKDGVIVNKARLFICFTVASPVCVNGGVSTDVSAGEIRTKRYY